MPGGIGSGGIVDIPFPPNGAVGYVLGKLGAADYSFDWVPPGGGGAGVASISAGTTQATGPQVIFSNSPTVTFGANGNTITASANVPGGGGAAISAGTQSGNTGTIVFSNSNGISFGMSNSSIVTASYTVPTQTNQSLGIYGSSQTTGQSSSSTYDARSLTIVGSGNLSVGWSNSSLILNVTTAAQSAQAAILSLSAGTTRITNGEAVFSNSNGVSFGVNGQTVTASIATSLTNINVSAGTTSNNLSAITFSNANGVSFGLNGSTLTATVKTDYLTLQSVDTLGIYASSQTFGQSSSSTYDARSLTIVGSGGISVGWSNSSLLVSGGANATAISGLQVSDTTYTSGTVTFRNANGISFGSSGANGISASYTVPTQTNQTLGIYGSSQTTGQSSSSTYDARSLTIVGQGIVSVGWSNSSLLVSAQTLPITASAFAQSNTTQSSSGTIPLSSLMFAGAGAASVGISNGSVVISAPNAAAGNVTFSAGTTSNGLGSIVFSNSNGISFGLNGSTITASVATSLTNINVSAGTTSNNLSAITFSNSNGVSFGLNASTVTASVATSLTNINVSAGTTSNNLSAITFSNSNGVSFGLNGSVVTGSVATSLTNINVSAGTTSNNLSAIVFSNSNNMTFGLNGSTVTGSYTAPNTFSVFAQSNTTQSSSGTMPYSSLQFAGAGVASVGVTNGSVVISVPSGGGGITNINISAGTTSNNLSAVTFSNSNGVSFGLNASTVTASIATSLTNINVSAGTTSNNLSAITFADSNGVSFGLNGSVVTATVATHARRQHLVWPPGNPFQTLWTIDNGKISYQLFDPAGTVVATRAMLGLALSGNTNSSGALTISLGIYTMNGSTASLASSDSRQISWTSGSATSDGSSVYAGVSGTHFRTISLNNWSIADTQYLIAIWLRTTNNGTWQMLGLGGVSFNAPMTDQTNETGHWWNGFKPVSFSTAMQASLNLTATTDIARTGSNFGMEPGLMLMGSF